MSAPIRMSMSSIKTLAASRLDWIRRHLSNIERADIPPDPDYVSGETHHVWGEGRELRVTELESVPKVQVAGGELLLQVRPGASLDKREETVRKWYRQELKDAAPALINKWEPLIDVQVGKLFIQRMKSRWGTCNYRTHAIRLNSELAKRRPELLEYVVVHEMVHILEPSHNKRFKELMDGFMPNWRDKRNKLNRM